MDAPDIATARESLDRLLGRERARRMCVVFIRMAAADGVHLRDCVAARDSLSIATTMHRLRSSLRMLGYDEAARLCGRIEDDCRNGAFPERTRRACIALSRWLGQLDALAGGHVHRDASPECKTVNSNRQP